MSASPKKQASKQAVIKLTATSAASNSPVARALFQPETQGALLANGQHLKPWSCGAYFSFLLPMVSKPLPCLMLSIQSGRQNAASGQ